MKRLLKANALMGLSTVITILSGILRAKLLALLVGTAGIGLLGLLQSTLGVALSLSGLGMSKVAVREVAPAARDEDWAALATLRSALALVVGVGAVVGLAIMVWWRAPIATKMLEDSALAWMVIVLGAGMIIQNISTVMTSWLNGFSQTARVVKIQIFTAATSAVIGVLAVAALGMSGVIVAVLAAPACQLLAAWWHVRARSAETPEAARAWVWSASPVLQRARHLVPLGVSLALGTAVEMGCQLGLRAIIMDFGGKNAVGLFQSAAAIASMYMGFLLAAMAVDFFPRLSAAEDDAERGALINEQLFVGWLLTLPLLLGLFATAPLVLYILYSADFTSAAAILRWQLLGDIFKIPVWVFSYLLLAQSRSAAYLVTQTVLSAVYLGVLHAGLPLWQLEAAGAAFLCAQVITAAGLWLYVRKAIGFRFERRSARLGLTGVLCAGLTMGCALTIPPAWAWLPELLIALVAGVVCGRVLWGEFREVVMRLPVLNKIIPRVVARLNARRAPDEDR